MRTWDAATGEPRAVWRFTEYSQRVLPGGLALGYRANPEKGQKAVVVRDIRTGEARCELTGRGLKESAGGRTAWAGEAMSGNWIEYDLATGRALRSVRTRPGAIAGLSADGSLLVLREDGGKRISGWDVADGKTRFHWLAADHGLFRRRTEYSPGAMDEASVSPDGRRLAALIDRTELWVCKLETGELVRRARVEANTGRLLTFRPDGKVLAVVDGRTIRLLNAGTGEDLAEFVGHLNVTALAFSRDGKRLASGSTDGTAIVWDVSHITP